MSSSNVTFEQDTVITPLKIANGTVPYDIYDAVNKEISFPILKDVEKIGMISSFQFLHHPFFNEKVFFYKPLFRIEINVGNAHVIDTCPAPDDYSYISDRAYRGCDNNYFRALHPIKLEEPD